MKYRQLSKKEKIMDTKCNINGRIGWKSGWRHGSGFVLAAILALGLSTPAQALALDSLGSGFLSGMSEAAYNDSHASNITLATIRVPIKVSDIQPSAPVRATCTAYDRPHGSLRARGDGHSNADTASGGVNTTVVVVLHPLKSVSGVTLPLVTWQCHLGFWGRTSRSGLAGLHKPGTTYRPDISGSF